MAASGYVADSFVAGEQPTTAKWNELWGNDASFNNGNGFNDGIIVSRHLNATSVQQGNIDWSTFAARVTDIYLNAYDTGALTGATQGTSYSYSGTLPRALQTNEQVMLIGTRMDWCSMGSSSASGSTFNYTLNCVVTSNLMRALITFIYFRKGS